jgi:hypothetical protein
MAGHGEKLTRKQEQAIAALLTERTIGNAARKIKVGERTLRLWLSQPPFRQAYEKAKGELLAQTVALLTNAAGEAVETLRQCLQAQRDGDKIRAASALLDQLVRLREHGEVEERLKALEGILGKWKGQS